MDCIQGKRVWIDPIPYTVYNIERLKSVANLMKCVHPDYIPTDKALHIALSKLEESNEDATYVMLETWPKKCFLSSEGCCTAWCAPDEELSTEARNFLSKWDDIPPTEFSMYYTLTNDYIWFELNSLSSHSNKKTKHCFRTVDCK